MGQREVLTVHAFFRPVMHLHLKKQVLEKDVIRARDGISNLENRSFNLPISRLDAQPVATKHPEES